jgi:RNA polymerase sigma-70 factor, ECF subfamily
MNNAQANAATNSALTAPSINMAQCPDEYLMGLVRDGDRDAFSILIQRYQMDLYRYCLSFLRQPDQAQDAAQDVLIRVFQNAAKFDTSRKFKPWLFRVARNLCISMINRGNLIQMDPLYESTHKPMGTKGVNWESTMPNPSDLLLRKETREHLQKALKRLSPQCREVVELRYFHRMRARDIAEITGSAEGAVRTKLHRALKTLKEDLRRHLV